MIVKALERIFLFDLCETTLCVQIFNAILTLWRITIIVFNTLANAVSRLNPV
jgi:hypothetical protein